MSFDYRTISDTNGDFERMIISEKTKGNMWKIHNLYPHPITVTLQKYGNDTTSIIGDIPSGKILGMSPSSIEEGDSIYFFFRSEGGNIHSLTEGYSPRSFQKNIYAGVVSYTSGGGHGEVQASNYDIKGVYLQNLLSVPMKVYYKGNLVATLGAYDGMGYMGGGRSELYFSNSRQGLNIGDVLEFVYSLTPHSKEYNIQAIIDDMECSKIMICTTTGYLQGPDPDNALYKNMTYNYMGISYYVPAGGYRYFKTPSTSF